MTQAKYMRPGLDFAVGKAIEMLQPPLRRIVQQADRSFRLECGHMYPRRPGWKQPKRVRCAYCLPLPDRLAWLTRSKR